MFNPVNITLGWRHRSLFCYSWITVNARPKEIPGFEIPFTFAMFLQKIVFSFLLQKKTRQHRSESSNQHI